jgi:mono/diheme cytochrome c family protein
MSVVVPSRLVARRFSIALLSLSLTGCPDGPPADGGTTGGDGTIVIDGQAQSYTLDADASSLLIVIEKKVTVGCPSFFHSHVFEAGQLSLSFDIDEGAAAASTLSATVPARSLIADEPTNRALFDLTKDEDVPASFRGDIKSSGLSELDAATHPNLVFKVLSLDALAAGADGELPNTAEIEVEIAGEKSTIPMQFRYVKDGTTRTIIAEGVLDGREHGMPRKTECYKAESLPLHLTLVLVPGEEPTVVDAGPVDVYTPEVFPYAGDCANKIAFNTVRDIAVRTCAGCHATTPRFGATSSLVTYEDFRRDTFHNRGVPAFETMRSYLNAADGKPQMPPIDQAPLSVDDKNQLLAWIDQGGPDCNDGVPATVFTPVNAVACGTPNYADDVKTIFEQNCSFCHLDTGTTLPAIGYGFAAGAASATHPYYQPLTVFEASLLRIEDGTMPPDFAVSPTEAALVRTWVEAGYPESACP